MTVSCIEETYKKYIAITRERYPGMFLQPKYTPHTCATHMLEAGVPLMAIKNFLGGNDRTVCRAFPKHHGQAYPGMEPEMVSGCYSN